MFGQDLVDQLKQQFGELVTGANLDNIDPWIEIAPEGLTQICQYLHDQPTLAFDYLNLITGVDYLHMDEKKAKKADWQPHGEVVYHLSSLQHKHRLVLKVMVPRWKEDQEGHLPEVPSVAQIWKTAHWHEREVYDLSGIRFMEHPEMTRILCPEDWIGHPLRKDYEMPLEYHGIRAK